MGGSHMVILRQLAKRSPSTFNHWSAVLTHWRAPSWLEVNKSTPIDKKCRKEDPGSYTPASMTSMPGRLCSRSWMLSHSTHRTTSRSGPDSMSLWKAAWLTWSPSIIRWPTVDEGEAVDVVYLWTSKAFDTTSPIILLENCLLTAWTKGKHFAG